MRGGREDHGQAQLSSLRLELNFEIIGQEIHTHQSNVLGTLAR